MKFISVLLPLFLLTLISRAQEINFSRVQDMAIWYNQSLKTDKNKSIKLNMRDVRYQGLMAYKSIAAMVDVPLVSAEGRESERTGYLSVSLGAASDKSNQGILSNTMGLAGISYSVPIAGNETFVSFGVQGSYYQSRLNPGGEAAFGDQYDQYGPVEGLQSSDRVASGWSYNHLDVNAGMSLFSNGESNKWYVGASVMHINKAYTDDAKSAEFKLKYAYGIQAGYTFITPTLDAVSFHTSLNWQGKAYKHFANIGYFKSIPSVNGGVGFGLGYRYDDAVVPNVEIRYSKATLSLGYDVNVSPISAAGFRRNGIELAVKFDF